MPTLNVVAKALAREYVGVDTDTSYVTQIEAWLNEAYAEVAEELRWEWTIGTPEVVSVVAATSEYSLAISVGEETVGRLLSSDAPIYFKTREELVLRGTDLEATGTPYIFMPIGYDAATDKFKIRLFPVPSANDTAHFLNFTRPAELATGAAIPVPNGAIGAIKMLARSFMSNDDGFGTDSDRWYGRYLRRMNSLRRKEHTNPGELRQIADSDVKEGRRRMPRLPSGYPTLDD